jgi:PD-(D/E)XK nuclease superfamily
VTFSYTQISQYLACPRKYRYRYRDGWQEKDNQAAMLFGRVFELALAAYFRHEDAPGLMFQEWEQFRNASLEYPNGSTWDDMLRQGLQLLNRFAQENRIRVLRPWHNQQVKFTRALPGGHAFVSYVDAIGRLDGTPCLLEWKTTGARYPEDPQGIVALDPQLVCYSWATGMADCALVVFVRKRLVEIQYLRTTITEEQGQQFGELVSDTVQQIEAGHFPQHSGIRFPQSPCTSCAFIGLCLGQQSHIDGRLERRQGDGLAWVDELAS